MFNDAEGVLHFGKKHGSVVIYLCVDTNKFAAFQRLAHDTPDRDFFAVQQFVPNPAVMKLCCRGPQTLGRPALLIDTNMRILAEIPVVALIGGIYRKVEGLGLVLGRLGRGDDRDVHQRVQA